LQRSARVLHQVRQALPLVRLDRQVLPLVRLDRQVLRLVRPDRQVLLVRQVLPAQRWLWAWLVQNFPVLRLDLQLDLQSARAQDPLLTTHPPVWRAPPLLLHQHLGPHLGQRLVQPLDHRRHQHLASVDRQDPLQTNCLRRKRRELRSLPLRQHL